MQKAHFWLGYFAAFVCYTTASCGGNVSLAVEKRCPILAWAVWGGVAAELSAAPSLDGTRTPGRGAITKEQSYV